MRRITFGLLMVFGTTSLGQPLSYCPAGSHPKQQNPKCAPSMRGDPINMLSGHTLDIVKDFTINVGDEQFAFTRTFSSSDTSGLLPSYPAHIWPSDAKPPFGRTHVAYAPRWLHSLFSVVRVDAQKVQVLVPELYWTEFTTTCFTSSPCFLEPTPNMVGTGGFNGTRLRLQRLGPLSARRFILIREDGEHWRYEPDPASAEISRLVAVEDRLGRTRYTLTYSVPAGCSGYCGAPRLMSI